MPVTPSKHIRFLAAKEHRRKRRTYFEACVERHSHNQTAPDTLAPIVETDE